MRPILSNHSNGEAGGLNQLMLASFCQGCCCVSAREFLMLSQQFFETFPLPTRLALYEGLLGITSLAAAVGIPVWQLEKIGVRFLIPLNGAKHSPEPSACEGLPSKLLKHGPKHGRKPSCKASKLHCAQCMMGSRCQRLWQILAKHRSGNGKSNCSAPKSKSFGRPCAGMRLQQHE